MNEQLQAFARAEILKGLEQLTENNRMLFKRMYSHGNLDKSIEDVVADMPAEKLDWAMQQVENTLRKRAMEDEST